MPCYEVRTYNVAFESANLSFLKKALDALGWKHDRLADGRISLLGGDIILDLATKKATVKGNIGQDNLNKLKRAYSGVVIETTARRNQWRNVKSEGAQQKGILRKF